MPKLQKRLRNWLDENYDRSQGWHVWAQLMNTAAENYATKEARRRNNQYFRRRNEDTDEYQRLSSEF